MTSSLPPEISVGDIGCIRDFLVAKSKKQCEAQSLVLARIVRDCAGTVPTFKCVSVTNSQYHLTPTDCNDDTAHLGHALSSAVAGEKTYVFACSAERFLRTPVGSCSVAAMALNTVMDAFLSGDADGCSPVTLSTASTTLSATTLDSTSPTSVTTTPLLWVASCFQYRLSRYLISAEEGNCNYLSSAIIAASVRCNIDLPSASTPVCRALPDSTQLAIGPKVTRSLLNCQSLADAMNTLVGGTIAFVCSVTGFYIEDVRGSIDCNDQESGVSMLNVQLQLNSIGALTETCDASTTETTTTTGTTSMSTTTSDTSSATTTTSGTSSVTTTTSVTSSATTTSTVTTSPITTLPAEVGSTVCVQDYLVAQSFDDCQAQAQVFQRMSRDCSGTNAIVTFDCVPVGTSFAFRGPIGSEMCPLIASWIESAINSASFNKSPKIVCAGEGFLRTGPGLCENTIDVVNDAISEFISGQIQNCKKTSPTTTPTSTTTATSSRSTTTTEMTTPSSTTTLTSSQSSTSTASSTASTSSTRTTTPTTPYEGQARCLAVFGSSYLIPARQTCRSFATDINAVLDRCGHVTVNVACRKLPGSLIEVIGPKTPTRGQGRLDACTRLAVSMGSLTGDDTLFRCSLSGDYLEFTGGADGCDPANGAASVRDFNSRLEWEKVGDLTENCLRATMTTSITTTTSMTTTSTETTSLTSTSTETTSVSSTSTLTTSESTTTSATTSYTSTTVTTSQTSAPIGRVKCDVQPDTGVAYLFTQGGDTCDEQVAAINSIISSCDSMTNSVAQCVNAGSTSAIRIAVNCASTIARLNEAVDRLTVDTFESAFECSVGFIRGSKGSTDTCTKSAMLLNDAIAFVEAGGIDVNGCISRTSPTTTTITTSLSTISRTNRSDTTMTPISTSFSLSNGGYQTSRVTSTTSRTSSPTTTTTTPTTELVCGPREFRCADKSACIPLAFRCDYDNRNFDCIDQSDEQGCPLQSTSTPRSTSAPILTTPSSTLRTTSTASTISRDLRNRLKCSNFGSGQFLLTGTNGIACSELARDLNHVVQRCQYGSIELSCDSYDGVDVLRSDNCATAVSVLNSLSSSGQQKPLRCGFGGFLISDDREECTSLEEDIENALEGLRLGDLYSDCTRLDECDSRGNGLQSNCENSMYSNEGELTTVCRLDTGEMFNNACWALCKGVQANLLFGPGIGLSIDGMRCSPVPSTASTSVTTSATTSISTTTTVTTQPCAIVCKGEVMPVCHEAEWVTYESMCHALCENRGLTEDDFTTGGVCPTTTATSTGSSTVSSTVSTTTSLTTSDTTTSTVTTSESSTTTATSSLSSTTTQTTSESSTTTATTSDTSTTSPTSSQSSTTTLTTSLSSTTSPTTSISSTTTATTSKTTTSTVTTSETTTTATTSASSTTTLTTSGSTTTTLTTSLSTTSTETTSVSTTTTQTSSASTTTTLTSSASSTTSETTSDTTTTTVTSTTLTSSVTTSTSMTSSITTSTTMTTSATSTSTDTTSQTSTSTGTTSQTTTIPPPSSCRNAVGPPDVNGVHHIEIPATSEILPVVCDTRRKGGGWTQIFHHDYADKSAGLAPLGAIDINTESPRGKLYSIISRISDFQSSTDIEGLEFMMEWPGANSRYLFPMIWKQSDLPVDESTIPAGYEAVDLPYPGETPDTFWGLHFSNADETTFDASRNSWAFAVMQSVEWKGKLRGPGSSAVDQVTLWLREIPRTTTTTTTTTTTLSTTATTVVFDYTNTETLLYTTGALPTEQVTRLQSTVDRNAPSAVIERLSTQLPDGSTVVTSTLIELVGQPSTDSIYTITVGTQLGYRQGSQFSFTPAVQSKIDDAIRESLLQAIVGLQLPLAIRDALPTKEMTTSAITTSLTVASALNTVTDNNQTLITGVAVGGGSLVLIALVSVIIMCKRRSSSSDDRQGPGASIDKSINAFNPRSTVPGSGGEGNPKTGVYYVGDEFAPGNAPPDAAHSGDLTFDSYVGFNNVGSPQSGLLSNTSGWDSGAYMDVNPQSAGKVNRQAQYELAAASPFTESAEMRQKDLPEMGSDWSAAAVALNGPTADNSRSWV